ncbi:membrane protein insertase YidC [Aerococcus christensenii]|uniref:Putative stage III sporulation protein J n=1 Tax=Aerococcus christensenii TaxID=87541 RepID=A0A133XZ30_9LACT|nr:membrane protein insertase YidC [Aerococcus christensenii]KXB36177.1 putative stage III sporulation protein J [Aerococcus christensenii]MDK8233679.1 membrane protein insertase YidC [Aerococcus christensenii]
MKNKSKYFYQLLLLLGIIILLGGCGNVGAIEPITADSPGLWNKLVYMLSQVIVGLSHLFKNNYGLGILCFTIIMRLILVPLYHFQMKNSEKMQMMQPEVKALREKYASRDPETQEKLGKELEKLNQKYDMNKWAGILPLLIQLPILTALYQAILRTKALTTGNFLWMELGKSDPFFILPILAAVAMWYSTYLMQVSSGNKSVATTVMQYAMAGMMFLIMMGLPSAVSLYMATANVFTIGQMLLLNNPYQKQQDRKEKELKEKELEHRLEKARRNPRGKKRK